MQVCIVFTSDPGCEKGMRHTEMQNASRVRTYKTDSLGMNHGGGKLMKSLGDMLKQCYELIVAFSEFTEGLRLLLKEFSDRKERVTEVELVGKWMSSEVYPRLNLILAQSRLKERFEGRGFREGSHVICEENCMAERS